MMTGRVTKAALAAANATMLPTAAPRQVNNLRYADQRRAGRAAREASPFNGRWQHPHDREADKLAEVLSGIERTPELLIVSAMLRAMDADAVAKVLEKLAPDAITGSVPHAQAVATVHASRLTFGRKWDLLRAFARQRGEG